MVHLPVFPWEVSLEEGGRWRWNQPQQTRVLTARSEGRRLLLSQSAWQGKHPSWGPGWSPGRKQHQSWPAGIKWTQNENFRHQFFQVLKLFGLTRYRTQSSWGCREHEVLKACCFQIINFVFCPVREVAGTGNGPLLLGNSFSQMLFASQKAEWTCLLCFGTEKNTSHVGVSHAALTYSQALKIGPDPFYLLVL